MIVLGVILLVLGWLHSVDDRHHRPDHRGCLLRVGPAGPRGGWTQALVLSADRSSHESMLM
jgi:hypothetical protein